MTPNPIPDERRTAPPVPEHHNDDRGPSARWLRHTDPMAADRPQMTKDRTALCRGLFVAGVSKVEIAEILGVHWAQVDQVLSGTA